MFFCKQKECKLADGCQVLRTKIIAHRCTNVRNLGANVFKIV